MRSLTKKIVAVSATALATLALAACEDAPDSQQREATQRQNNYDRLTANQPAESMNYSPSRATINEWTRTWDEPNKLSYIYFLNADGEAWGYYVLEGLPVSYCAALTPTYEIYDGYDSDFAVPAPGIDGVYYSGAQCNTYFGIDATTGTMVEWTAGLGTSTITYEEPMEFPGARALGPTEVEEVDQ